MFKELFSRFTPTLTREQLVAIDHQADIADTLNVARQRVFALIKQGRKTRDQHD